MVTTPLTGRYLLTSVRLERASRLGTLLAALRTDRDHVPVGPVLPQGVDPREYAESQREVFQESRHLAAAAAARAAGLPVRVSGSGVRVVEVLPDSPAAGVLRTGDIIVTVDGQPVDDAGELRDLVQARAAGSRLRLELEGGRRVTVPSARLPGVSGGVGIGVAVETRDLRIDLPFQVRFAERPDIGGPSARLAYALAVADLLEWQDYASGRTIAATGTIQADGDVGEVGGVEQKAIAAAGPAPSGSWCPARSSRRHGTSGSRSRGSTAWSRRCGSWPPPPPEPPPSGTGGRHALRAFRRRAARARPPPPPPRSAPGG
jgi:PDZ domain-containing protein